MKRKTWLILQKEINEKLPWGKIKKLMPGGKESCNKLKNLLIRYSLFKLNNSPRLYPNLSLGAYMFHNGDELSEDLVSLGFESLQMIITYKSVDGIHFNLNFNSFWINLHCIEEIETTSVSKDRYQKQQFKYAARQNRRK
jgi:hypothetical protein